MNELDAALRALAAGRVTVGSRPIADDDVDSLLAEERDAVSRASPKRRREFATGRVLLRSLLGEPVVIPVASNRAPKLPAGIAGSLAHDDEVAIAAISRNANVDAIGIDIEPSTPLTPDVGRLVRRSDDPRLDAHLIFTIKESVYKAWSALGGDVLEHHDVRIDAVERRARRDAAVRFDAAIVGADTRFANKKFGGRFVSTTQRHLALVVVEHAA